MPGGVPGPDHPGRHPWCPRPPHPQVPLHDPVFQSSGSQARDIGRRVGRSTSVILCGAQYKIPNGNVTVSTCVYKSYYHYLPLRSQANLVILQVWPSLGY